MAQIGQGGEGLAGLGFTPDNRHILAFARNARGLFVFRSWDLASDEVRTLSQIEGPSSWPYSVDLSRDGTRLAMSLANATQVVEVAGGKVLLESPAPADKHMVGMCTRLSPDGRRVVTVLWWSDRPRGPFVGGRLRVDDLSSGRSDMLNVEGRVWEPFFTADGQRVGAVHDGSADELALDFWHVSPLRHARRVPLLKKAECLGWNQGVAPWVVVWHKDRSVRLFDPRDGKEVYRTEPVENVVSRSLAPDGRVLAVSDRTSCRLYRLPAVRKP